MSKWPNSESSPIQNRLICALIEQNLGDTERAMAKWVIHVDSGKGFDARTVH